MCAVAMDIQISLRAQASYLIRLVFDTDGHMLRGRNLLSPTLALTP